MKQSHLYVLAVSALLLAACGGTTTANSSSSPAAGSSSPAVSSSEPTSSSSSSSSVVVAPEKADFIAAMKKIATGATGYTVTKGTYTPTETAGQYTAEIGTYSTVAYSDKIVTNVHSAYYAAGTIAKPGAEDDTKSVGDNLMVVYQPSDSILMEVDQSSTVSPSWSAKSVMPSITKVDATHSFALLKGAMDTVTLDPVNAMDQGEAYYTAIGDHDGFAESVVANTDGSYSFKMTAHFASDPKTYGETNRTFGATMANGEIVNYASEIDDISDSKITNMMIATYSNITTGDNGAYTGAIPDTVVAYTDVNGSNKNAEGYSVYAATPIFTPMDIAKVTTVSDTAKTNIAKSLPYYLDSVSKTTVSEKLTLTDTTATKPVHTNDYTSTLYTDNFVDVEGSQVESTYTTNDSGDKVYGDSVTITYGHQTQIKDGKIYWQNQESGDTDNDFHSTFTPTLNAINPNSLPTSTHTILRMGGGGGEETKTSPTSVISVDSNYRPKLMSSSAAAVLDVTGLDVNYSYTQAAKIAVTINKDTSNVVTSYTIVITGWSGTETWTVNPDNKVVSYVKTASSWTYPGSITSTYTFAYDTPVAYTGSNTFAA
jgi:hypothetical protein